MCLFICTLCILLWNFDFLLNYLKLQTKEFIYLYILEFHNTLKCKWDLRAKQKRDVLSVEILIFASFVIC